MARVKRFRFICMDCKQDTGRMSEHYMLVDSTWFEAHPSKQGMLCVGCVEDRLGRKLQPSDFNDSYLNTSCKFERSSRLISRMKIREKEYFDEVS